MKKMLIVTICTALAFTFTACGNSSSDSPAETEETVEETEEFEQEEEFVEELEEPQEEAPVETKYETATYKRMTYSYPADSEYTESDDVVTITLGDNEALIMIMSIDLSESEDEYDEDGIDLLLDATILSMNATYDEVQNDVLEDLTIDGCPSREETAMVNFSSTWMNFNGIAIYDEEGKYVYAIQYLDNSGSEEILTDYQEFLDSISIGEATDVENEDTDSDEVSDENNSLVADVDGGKTFTQDQLDITAVPTEDGLVAVFITNNSDDIVRELDVQINYKDESGTTIDMDSDGHDIVLPGSTVVSRMKTPDTYADFEIETDIDLDAHPKYENHAADVEINSNLGEDGIIIEITNNSDVTIEEIEYDVVLYENGNIVTIMYPQDVYDVEPGKTVTEKESTYGKEFDDYEIYLNQAHTFNIGS